MQAGEAIVGRTKLIHFFIILALGVLGYLLGPSDLVRGDYQARIEAHYQDTYLAAVLPFQLDAEEGDPQSVATAVDGYTLVVEGQTGYRYAFDQRISYRAQLQDGQGQPVVLEFDQLSSTILGEDYAQVLPPTENQGDWMLFSMRTPYLTKVVTSLLLVVAGLWLTELVPLAAAALLIPVVASVAGVANESLVYQSFFHPIVVLFFAGFLLAEGMRRTGVDRVIALIILRYASSKPVFLMLTMMSVTAFFSLWMSNTASVALMVPIALAVLKRLPEEGAHTGFNRALILGVAYAATVGGIGSAIGTPANILALDFLNEFAGAEISFAGWFAYGLPVLFIMVPVIWLYLVLSFGVGLKQISDNLPREVYDVELAGLGPMTARQKLLLIVFASVIGLWLTESYHQIDTSIVALAGVLVLFFTETIKQADLGRLNWNALLTFGGGLAIGNLLLLTGFSDWVALKLVALSEVPVLLVVLVVVALAMVIGAFISNTATAAMLIPLAIPLAHILHMDPRLLVCVIAIASSLDFALVIGTPPTMMAYSTGLFEVKDIFRRGIVLDVVSTLLLSFGIIWIWKWLGVVSF